MNYHYVAFDMKLYAEHRMNTSQIQQALNVT